MDGGRRNGEALARGHPAKGRPDAPRRTETLSSRAPRRLIAQAVLRQCDEIAARRPGLAGRAEAVVGALVVGGFALFGVAAGGHAGMLGESVRDGVERALIATGTTAQIIQITGLKVLDEATVADIAGIRPGGSLIMLDARAARERLEELPFVAEAKVQKFFPGGLRVEIVEREPFAVWQKDGALSIIDRNGVILRPANPSRLPDLPVIVGAGAPESAAALFRAMAPFPRLGERLHAAVLVAGRRWNLIFDSGLVAKLPEGLLVGALEDLDRLDRDHRLIDRDIAQIDMRIAGRLTVRPNPAAETAAPAGRPS